VAALIKTTSYGRRGRAIAKRCLAHNIRGVRGIYDRYKYLEEKPDALERLAGLIGGL